MSDTTIHVPVEHVEAIRLSLIELRGDACSQEEIDALLGQLGDVPPGTAGSVALKGRRVTLWTVTYDALCRAAEQLVEDCDEYWRGAVGAESARRRVADVGERLELLLGLGAPPASS